MTEVEKYLIHDYLNSLLKTCDKENPVSVIKRIQRTINMIPARDEMCANVSDVNDADAFECSECGIRIEGYCGVEVDDECPDELNFYEFHAKYCPNCGRKIKE